MDEMTEFRVRASDDADDGPFHLIGVMPSYHEALDRAEQAGIDGWAAAWVQSDYLNVTSR